MGTNVYRSCEVSFDAFQTSGTSGKTNFEAVVSGYSDGSLQMMFSVRGAIIAVYPTTDNLRRLAVMLNEAADGFDAAVSKLEAAR